MRNRCMSDGTTTKQFTKFDRRQRRSKALRLSAFGQLHDDRVRRRDRTFADRQSDEAAHSLRLDNFIRRRQPRPLFQWCGCERGFRAYAGGSRRYDCCLLRNPCERSFEETHFVLAAEGGEERNSNCRDLHSRLYPREGGTAAQPHGNRALGESRWAGGRVPGTRSQQVGLQNRRQSDNYIRRRVDDRPDAKAHSRRFWTEIQQRHCRPADLQHHKD